MSAEVGHVLNLILSQVQPSESWLRNAADVHDFVLAHIQSLQNEKTVTKNLNQAITLNLPVDIKGAQQLNPPPKT